MISATLVLYRDAIKDTARALSRSAMVFVLPLVIYVLLAIVGGLIGVLPGALGFVGGLIHFVLSAYLYGAYLHLVGDALTRRKPIAIVDIKDSFGRNMREVMNLLFIYWILSLALGMAVRNGQIGADIYYVGMVVVFTLFNAGPEVIHQERSVGGMDILARSFRWLSQNGPEWVPNLVITALILYLQLNGLALALLVVGLLLHPWMLFRGALYRKIGNDSRRSRAWRSKF